jgi:hypothetical protein
MRFWTASYIALFAVVMTPDHGAAQIAATPQMQASTRSSDYEGIVGQVIARIPDTVFKRCATLVSTGSQITLLAPVTFGADGRPNNGRWRQSFAVSGCGDDKILNLYFTASSDGKISGIAAAPGTTHADLTLQRDGLFYAKLGASMVEKGCKNFLLSDTRFEALDDKSRPLPGVDPSRRSWSETWTMLACGHVVDVPIHFIPDPKGTTISAGRGVEH